MRNDVMTDWDVKKAFQETVKPVFFPTIFIDEYWDHYMDLFGQTEQYIVFREKFKSGGFTYLSYMDAYLGTVRMAAERQMTGDRESVARAVKMYADSVFWNVPGYMFPEMDCSDFPEGRYLQVDLKHAFDHVMKAAGVFNPEYGSTDEIIEEVRMHDIFSGMKKLRLAVYARNFGPETIGDLFRICSGELLKKVYLSGNDLMKDLRERYPSGMTGHGDMYMYNIGEDDMSGMEGDHDVDGIPVNMSVAEIREVKILGCGCKTMFIPGKSPVDYTLGWSGSNLISPELFPLVLRLCRDERPDMMDLAIGHEDRIFFHLNEHDYETK